MIDGDGGVARTDWRAWHRAYDDPGSVLSRRLSVVQAQLSSALDRCAPGEVRLLSMCAGDGRDVLGVLERHRRATDVRGVLVELDVDLSAAARTRAGRGGLGSLECVVGDAGHASHYASVAPVHVALACGVFGNVSDDDVHATIEGLGALTARGGTVVWTRHRRPPDLTPAIRRWFGECGFEELDYTEIDGSSSTVGCHVLVGPSTSEIPARLFDFVGDGSAAHL